MALAFAVACYAKATRPPTVVRYRVVSTQPGDNPSLRIVHLSDTHVALPDMPPARLLRIVAQVNALRPDIVVLTGDYVSDKFVGSAVATAAAIAPLGRLRARYGVFAVPGNHDHWRSIPATRLAFARTHIVLLANESRRAGPVVIAGVDDSFTGHADVAVTLASVPRAPVPIILISHSPDVFTAVPASVAVTLAGHTHGGQIVVPFYGPLATASAFGRRFVRGLIVEGNRTMIVSAGLGTSILPLRFGAPPEIVEVTLLGSAATASRVRNRRTAPTR